MTNTPPKKKRAPTKKLPVKFGRARPKQGIALPSNVNGLMATLILMTFTVNDRYIKTKEDLFWHMAQSAADLATAARKLLVGYTLKDIRKIFYEDLLPGNTRYPKIVASTKPYVNAMRNTRRKLRARQFEREEKKKK